MLRKTKIIGVGMIVVMAAVSVVSAHMALKKSMPEEGVVLTTPPDQVQLWFTQEPDPAVSNVSLGGPSGDVEIGETKVAAEKSVVASVPALGSGTYVVSWRTAGDDGHVQRGEFSFTVQSD